MFLCFPLLFVSPEVPSKAREIAKSRGSSGETKGKERVRAPESFMHLNCHKLGSGLKRSILHVCFFRASLTVAPFSVVVFPKLFSFFFLCKYVSPAPHFMLYYYQIANALGPLIHLWRMHFEAKLNTLKWLVHGVLILGISEKH